MKKQIILIIIVLLAVSQGLIEANYKRKYQKPRFYIKLSGIGTLINGGDFETFITENETYFTNLNNSSDMNNVYNVTLTNPSLSRGYSGEIGVDTEKYAVGISIGHIKKRFLVDYHYQNTTTQYEDNYTRDYTLSAIPVFIYIHYKLINTSFLTAYATLGEGVYISKYQEERQQTFQNYTLTFANSHIESKKNRLALHAGTTIDLNITSNLAISLEAAYRSVSRIKELTAQSYYEDDKNIVTNEDSLYYWTNTRTQQAMFKLGEPTGKIYWEGEPAIFNLSGFSFSLGLKITLGSKKIPTPVQVAPVD